MAAYVYILVHKDKPRFKIGKALDLASRVAQLTFDELDFSKSTALAVADEAAAVNLERALHRFFSKWRLAADEMVAHEGERFDGYTEWFRADCFEKLLAFINQNAELFDYTVLTSAQLEKKVKPAALSKPKAAYVSRPRVRRTITPEDVAGAKHRTQQLLPTLEHLLGLCDYAESLETQPGSRTLAGICKLEHAETARRLLHELIDEGSVKYSLGWFGIFNSTTTQETKEDFQFAITHIWPYSRPTEHAPWTTASETLASFTLPISGWSH